jgi:hypothetical protein
MRREIPLDVEGLIYRFLNPNCEIVWVTPWSLIESQRKELITSNSELLISLTHSQQKRLRKLRRQLNSKAGNWKSILPEVAIRHGKSQFAIAWMNGMILRANWKPTEKLEARARLLLSHDRTMVKRLILKSRQWPKNTWQLHDVSATYIPPFIFQLRKKITSVEVQIISGSHMLAEGTWRWIVAKDAIHPTSVQSVE